MNYRMLFWLTVGAAVLLTGSYSAFIWLNSEREIDRLQASMDTTDARVRTAIDQVREIPSLRSRTLASQIRTRALHDRILSPDSLTSAIRALEGMAFRHHVRVERITFSTDSLLEGLKAARIARQSSFELPLWLVLKGHYLDFGLMLERIEQLPCTIRFTDIRVVRDEPSGMLLFETMARLRIRSSSHFAKL